MSRKIKSFVMDLWISWWNIVCFLRPAFSRARTFLWFLLVLAAFSVRNDLLGVSSFVRALGLSEHFYEHLLHFFHSNAVKTDRLAELWFAIVIKHFPVYKIGCRPVLVLDGIKKSKEGRKMPAVKYLHQPHSFINRGKNPKKIVAGAFGIRLIWNLPKHQTLQPKSHLQ